MSHPHKDSPPPTADKGRHWSNKDRALVSSWIENEGQCVTLARLALHLSLPRTQASFLLQQQLAEAATKANSNKGVGEAVDHQQNDYDDKSSKRYHATWCEVEAKTWTAREDNGRMEEEEVVPCTEVQRSIEEGQGAGALTTETGAVHRRTLYALRLDHSSESTEAAHERDMADSRDILNRSPRSLLLVVLSPPSNSNAVGAPPLIAASTEMQVLWQNSLQLAAASVGGTGGGVLAASVAGPSSQIIRTKTTAASFFKSSEAAKASGNSKRKGVSSSSSKAATSSFAVTKIKSEDEKENKESRAKVKIEPPAANIAAAKSAIKIGNADDFVGDMDTDSDDEEGEERAGDAVMRDAFSGDEYETADNESFSAPASKPPPANKRAPQPALSSFSSKGRPGVQHPRDGSDNEEDDKKDVVANAPAKQLSGAMDAFATTATALPPVDAKPATRMRKRVVEKTFKDEHGYLQTELQEVWEEVPVEAAMGGTLPSKQVTVNAAPAAALPKAVSSNKSGAGKASVKTGLKQGSLKGFFTTKK